LEYFLQRTKEYIIKREEELEQLRLELNDTKPKAQEYLRKDALLAVVGNEKKNLQGEISKLELNNRKQLNEINAYRGWMSSLVDLLKLEDVENDKEYPILMDVISAQIKRIISNEHEKTAGQRSRLSQFQQKNKELRERNDALETQLAVLRRRLATLEDEEVRRNLSSAASLDRDRRKLTKQLEQSRAEISTLQSENSRLKSEMKSTSQNSLAAVGTNALLHAAETQAKELQGKCDLLEKELRDIRNERSQNESETKQKLLEFREVVARLLNLDCTELRVPDFEIVHRLEHIVLALEAPDIQGLHKDSLMRSL
uniref:Centrosomal protein of 70 kDa n=1 Tax=Rodentolepis nana TaxID=102285 RepID=A0A0R3TR69_RODNA